MNNFEITKDELINLAAEKLADQHGDMEEIGSTAKRIIEERVKDVFSQKVDKLVTDALTKALNETLTKQYQPVDMWGEPVGTPTTIRDQLTQRARTFWDESVDEHGKPTQWGGKPRHEHVYKQIAKQEFERALKDNAETIVAQFKAAILSDAVKVTTQHINNLIK